MAISAVTIGGGRAGGLAMGNVPAGKLGLTVDIIPTPVILAASLNKLGLDIRSFKEPLKRSVQQVVAPSFRKNFDVGGRPKWKPLSAVTVHFRQEEGFGPGPILVKSGLLKRVAGQLNIWTIDREKAHVNGLPRAEYGVIHQTGGFGGVTNEIPARPWALLQDEDVAEIEDVFVRWFQERLLAAGFLPGVL